MPDTGTRTDDRNLSELEAAAELGLQGDKLGAAKAYEALVAKGSPYAKVQLGYMLQVGDGVPRDLSRAEELLRSATDQGSLLGQYFLANLLNKTGRSEEAFACVAQAAEAGYLPAINRLGMYYMDGLGYTKDPVLGAHYRNVAADQGHLYAARWRAAESIRGTEGLIRVPVGLVMFAAVCAKIFWFAVRHPADPRVQT